MANARPDRLVERRIQQCLKVNENGLWRFSFWSMFDGGFKWQVQGCMPNPWGNSCFRPRLPPIEVAMVQRSSIRQTPEEKTLINAIRAS